MAAPAFASAGVAANAAGATLNVAYPSGIQAGDLLLLLALTKDNVEINLPSGWSQHSTGFRNQGTLTRAEWFWKRAVGNESGTRSVTKASGTTLFFARMYRFTGAPDGSADPFEAAAQTGLTASATLTPADIATLVQMAAAPGLTLDVKRHPVTGAIQKVAWANTSGAPVTVTLWNGSGSQPIEIGANETAEVAAEAGYVFDDCGPNVNVRHQ